MVVHVVTSCVMISSFFNNFGLNGECINVGDYVASRRISLVMSIIGLLIRQNSLGPLATPKGKRSRI